MSTKESFIHLLDKKNGHFYMLSEQDSREYWEPVSAKRITTFNREMELLVSVPFNSILVKDSLFRDYEYDMCSFFAVKGELSRSNKDYGKKKFNISDLSSVFDEKVVYAINRAFKEEVIQHHNDTMNDKLDNHYVKEYFSKEELKNLKSLSKDADIGAIINSSKATIELPTMFGIATSYGPGNKLSGAIRGNYKNLYVDGDFKLTYPIEIYSIKNHRRYVDS